MKYVQWFYIMQDCPESTFVLFSARTEEELRKRVAQRRRDGFQCSECTKAKGEHIKHYVFKRVKKK